MITAVEQVLMRFCLVRVVSLGGVASPPNAAVSFATPYTWKVIGANLRTRRTSEVTIRIADT